MRRDLIKSLSELIAADVITEETASRIRTYYQQREAGSPNRLMLVFGILGALLIGMGIILIIAHNWDEFSKAVKLLFSLLPLLVGQGICAYTLLRKFDNATWRETGAVFLFFAIAASLSMVSQVYHIPGDLSGFLLTWMLLSIPLVYAMRSAMTSLLTLAGITWYACSVAYFNYPLEVAWYYWLMLGALMPFVWMLSKAGRGNFLSFHEWVIASSIIITLGMFAGDDAGFIFVAYMSLFSFFVLLGEARGRAPESPGMAYLATGSLGSVVLLMLFTFDWIWMEIWESNLMAGRTFFVSLLVSLLAVAALMIGISRRGLLGVNPKGFIFLLFMVLFAVARFQPVVSQWATNVLVLVIAINTTWRGAERNNIVLLNYGLLIMTVLILCRFFDTDITFVVRGILFLAVGATFFGVNYRMLKKRKLQDI